MSIEYFENIIPKFPYKAIAFGLILFKYLFDNYLNYRQYKRICSNLPMPKELKEIGIEETKFKETKVYSKAKMEFAFISGLIKILIELFLIYKNYSAFIWRLSMKATSIIYLNSNNEYYVMTFFIVFETIKDTIIDIPFSYYHTFILEEKFGFNKTTMSTFIFDMIKNFADRGNQFKKLVNNIKE